MILGLLSAGRSRLEILEAYPYLEAAHIDQCLAYAEQDGVSMNQFIATAVAEKLASLATVEYLEQRAQNGSRDKFNAVLSKVPHSKPVGDEPDADSGT